MRCPGDFDPRAAGLVFDHARGWHKPEPLGGNVFAQADAIGGGEIEALRADRDALKARLAAAEAAAATAKVAADLFRERAEKAEARAERAVDLLAQARSAFRQDAWSDPKWPMARRIDALLKEVPHGQG